MVSQNKKIEVNSYFCPGILQGRYIVKNYILIKKKLFFKVPIFIFHSRTNQDKNKKQPKDKYILKLEDLKEEFIQFIQTV